MAFLDQLGSAISSQFGLGNGGPSSLDSVSDNAPLFSDNVSLVSTPYGKLGDFAGKIDQSANRSYVDSGYLRNIKPKALEITIQEPDITVVVKKRMFSSLAENYKSELMSYDEKLFIRASKRLFYNKCRAIAAYERLSKIEKATTNGSFTDTMLPLVFGSVDTLNALKPGLISQKTQGVFDTLRRIQNFSDSNFITTWSLDQTIPYATDLGDGVGTFEITSISSAEWTNTLTLGGGSASLTIEDPYKLTVMTSDDIDQALADVTSLAQNSFLKITQLNLEDITSQLKDELNKERLARNVSRITYYVNDQSILYNRVRAVIDEVGKEIKFDYGGGFGGIGGSVDVDPSFITNESNRTNQALTKSELKKFKQIIENIFIILGQKQTTSNQLNQKNKSVNYVRNKMRLHYAGKPLIQCMDQVHIFVSSKTNIDSEISRGLNSSFSNNSLLNKLNDVIGNIDSTLNTVVDSFSGNKGTYLDVEKNAIVGEDFPIWLWSLIRNPVTRQAAGTHVFGGVVETSSHASSGNKYTLSVTIKGNDNYFSFGQININPAVDVWNGDLYDPLTPFNTNFNPSSGFIDGSPDLLDENKKLLRTGVIKARLGKNSGQNLTEKNYANGDKEPLSSAITSQLFRTRLKDPYGYVYRWKEGIGTSTKFGEPHASASFPKETSPALTKDPFAGQSTINALSLLVTGQPYDFNTFLKAAIASGGLTREDLEKGTSGSSYLKGLIGDLNENNRTWGDFYPFKKMTVSDTATAYIMRGELDIVTKNNKLEELLRKRATKFDQLTAAIPSLANNPQFYKGTDKIDSKNFDSNILTSLGKEIINLDLEINKLQSSFDKDKEKYNNSQGGILNIYGNDISFDPNYTSTSTSPSAQARDREDFRKKINYLTQRRLWQVKGNQDKNLFIVDDTYDKNHDIQAFEAGLASGSFSTFASSYTTVRDRIQAVSQLLGLEVFADSQGHIQVRTPQYNRMPSSVFRNMLEQKQKNQVQLYPDFLESLFVEQISGLTEKIELVEDEIRLRTAAMGALNDADAGSLLSGIGPGSLSFSFVSNSDGKINSPNLKKLLFQSDPDYSSALSEISDLQSSVNAALVIGGTNNFDISKRISLLNNQDSFSKISESFENSNLAQYVLKIQRRIAIRTGVPPTGIRDLLPDSAKYSRNGISQLDMLNLTTKLSSLISERQSLIKLFANALKNLNEGVSLNADPSIAKNFLYTSLNKKPDNKFPEILAHMIEDEDYDDYGPNSGKRYIIKESQVLSFNITEKNPDWTVVQVDGAIENRLVEAASGLGIGGNGGNAQTSAFAVDYDMWRMYGFRQSHPVQAPFLTNPDTQCAPYAVSILNMARKNIFQASVNMIGNEYMQPGEVYYIEDRDLLFYAESVRSSFSYGQFTTNLTLKYGHSPGEYIPNILDILGKALYSRRNQSDLIHHERTGNSDGDINIAALVGGYAVGNYSNTTTDGTVSSLFTTGFSEENSKSLYDILLSASGATTSAGYNKDLGIEIRIYYNSTDQYASLKNYDSNLNSIANSIKDWIINPSSFDLEKKQLIPDNSLSSIKVDSQAIAKKIKIKQIDLSGYKSNKSASNKAWGLARKLVGIKPSTLTQGNDSAENFDASKVKEMLFKYVIDVWVTYNDTESVTEITKTTNSTQDQATQQQYNSYISSFASRLIQG